MRAPIDEEPRVWYGLASPGSSIPVKVGSTPPGSQSTCACCSSSCSSPYWRPSACASYSSVNMLGKGKRDLHRGLHPSSALVSL